jgi:hypothetical protein
MRQNPIAKDPKDSSGLSPTQLQTIEKLTLGTTITDTAAAVGVDRSTIHRWLNDDFQFQAELNRRRNDLARALDDRLQSLADEAVPAIQTAIRAGNPWIALAVLQGMGVLSGTRRDPESEDPDELEDDYNRLQRLRSL